MKELPEEAFMALDQKIRENQMIRIQQAESLDRKVQESKKILDQEAPKRRKAILDFVALFEEWQDRGYTFGGKNQAIKLSESKWSDLGWFEGHADVEEHEGWRKSSYFPTKRVWILVCEANVPNAPFKKEALGVMVQGIIQTYDHTEYSGDVNVPDRIVFQNTSSSYKRFFGMNELDGIGEALLPMLEALVEAINSPNLGKEYIEIPPLGGPA